jgi:hypothetical protein
MGVLDDISAAVTTYPREYLVVEIVQVDPPGDVINEDEEVSFRIQVANNGPLDANQISLLVEGLNGTLVKSNGPNAAFGDEFTISGAFFGNVPAHSNGPGDPGPVVTTGNPFKFKQGADAPAKDLVRVSVKGWSSGFDHIFNNHTQADPEANDVYNAQVFENPSVA